MSSSLLIEIEQQITRIGYSLCILIGNIGGIMSLFVFLQRSIRRNPCGLYFIAYVIINMMYINFTIVLAVLSSLFNINPSIQSSIFCRIQFYISFILAIIPSYLLVMASVDRSFASSSNVHTRSKSNRRFAIFMIGIICIFWILFHLHSFFTIDIQLLYGTQVCTYFQGFPAAFVSYYNLVCIGIIPFLLMIGFGIQISINIRQIRLNPNRSQNNRRLIVLLVIQIIIYIILRLPTSLYLVYKEITKSNIKSSNQLIIEQFIQSVVYFCQFIQISISPLLNLIIKTFRYELKQALNKIIRKYNPIHPIQIPSNV
ncbi:unnamed protein product [Adineta steineri]|uniref:G-protein coupled receptors family 1 profile domain-containing protein n=1 Tax=Adineta steineri TaxID=433720 RepID=A0A813VGB7_9BILA|nr:unnamed protein product [Adineta steineri]CAF0859314.1 unnamed protein product [Adineta steineri]CAF0919828.1 unnamed protein product [Adineta steineri]